MSLQQDGSRSDGAPAGVPRWVKRFLIVTAAIVVIGLAAMLLVGGQHGPGRHKSLESVAERPSTLGEPSGSLRRINA